MPRQARIIPENGYLHIIAKGNNQRRLFFCQRDFKIYYSLVAKLKIEEKIKILHYCFMPNHVHMLVEVNESSNLSRFMKRLNQIYANYYHKKHNYSGHLWQDRFKSKLIRWDEYFLQCGKYIELNPVKANLVKLPQDYAFSSYRHYAFGIKDKLIDDNPFYLNSSPIASERQRIYREMLINEMVEKKLKIHDQNSLNLNGLRV